MRLVLLLLSKLLYKSGRKCVELKVWESWSYLEGSITPLTVNQYVGIKYKWAERWKEVKGDSMKQWVAPGSLLRPQMYSPGEKVSNNKNNKERKKTEQPIPLNYLFKRKAHW